MKKTALLLALIMLLTCGIVFTSCESSSSSSKSSIEDDISDEIKYTLMAKISAYDAIYGKSLVYSSHTTNVRTVEKNEKYTVSGTVYAMEKGTKYSATYSGEVEYDAESDDFDFDIEVNSFK